MKNSSTLNDAHQEFGKKVLSAIPRVFPYVRHRLYIAETSGIIPRNMYQTNGIIDDAIIQVYENFEGKISDKQELKLKLFSIVDEKLNKLFQDESFHKNAVSTSKILKAELEMLEEKFESDTDKDLLMHEELDDISYHQNDREKPKFLYDDAEKNIIQALDMKDERASLSTQKRKTLHKIYDWLPYEISNVFDFYVFGQLTYDEIALIKDLSSEEVAKTLQIVRKSFRSNL
jgi:DNA-directed RNA polymerase specialized sigma24 family protein